MFFAAFFFPLGIYLPFFGVWLEDLGMSAQEIGFILTIPMITRRTLYADHGWYF
ncbi:MFS transporter [uncultured Cohaesibacter sp.]|uniref:MFS transporter n=1 Tax=uncultured Cohaesibacter sp. TaxID=1002546 RepID=UPI00374A1D88